MNETHWIETSEKTGRQGFSLVELVIAVVILSIGVLGLAATTGFVVQTVSAADVRTERTIAVQSAIERLNATEFEDLTAGSATIGRFDVSWTIDQVSTTARRVTLVSDGPGQQSAGGIMPVIGPNVEHTTTYLILRP